MKKVTTGVLAGTLAAAVAAGLSQAPATAAIRQDAPSQADRAVAHRPDNRPGPLTERQTRLRKAAVEALISGRATAKRQEGGGSVVTLSKQDGAVAAAELFDWKSEAHVLSILSEFGSETVGRYGGDAGPLHNEIEAPDREFDNSTTYEENYNQAYYDELFNGAGESMRDFYLEASDGQYTVKNTVEDWVTVPYNDAYYGANPREDEGGAWDFIEDTGNAWFDKMAATKSPAEIDAYLAQFDVWDRYDYDTDGNFNEADGYIDHFQAIHAGEGEEAGAPAEAIWSHRWYVNGTDYGSTGPTVTNDEGQQEQVRFGGARIGQSKYFIGDYTVEPENGGLGVFVHEYGHDLGLPDFYDTAGGENGTAFWTIMSSGSWLGHGEAAEDGIGTTPGGFGPDEKLFLGWLDYETLDPGNNGTFTLAPSNAGTDPADGTTEAVVVNLPDKDVEHAYTTPPAGTHAWWSGSADNLSNTLTRTVPAGGDRVTVTAKAWYDIEAGYDYLYGEYSLDNGKSWTTVGQPVDGSSNGRWTTLRYAYPAGGAESLFRFRYQTDGGVSEAGAFLDEITVSSGRTFSETDGAEGAEGTSAWVPKGWTVSTGTETDSVAQYYLLENRQYVGYDATLETGPYQFSEGLTRPDWVEFFAVQPGMLVWFADKSQPDNNTIEHQGYGQALPVDARPVPFTYPDGTKPSNRRQPYDATFGLAPSKAVCLHKEVVVGKGKAQTVDQVEACRRAEDNGAIPTFTDAEAERYWSEDNPLSSTKVAEAGVTATVTSDSDGLLTVDVTGAKPATPAS